MAWHSFPATGAQASAIWLSGLLPSSVSCVLFFFSYEDDTEGDLAKKGRPSPWRFPIRTGQLGLSRSPHWRGWGGREELMVWEMAGQGARPSQAGWRRAVRMKQCFVERWTEWPAQDVGAAGIATQPPPRLRLSQKLPESHPFQVDFSFHAHMWADQEGQLIRCKLGMVAQAGNPCNLGAEAGGLGAQGQPGL